MDDNVERIVLEADPEPAIQGAESANQALVDLEKSGQRTADSLSRGMEQAGERIIRVFDRSRASSERLIASVEKKAAIAGLDKIGQLAAERAQLINRLGGDQQSVDRVTAAYERLTNAERAAANVSFNGLDLNRSGLERAISASQKAEKSTTDFNKALASQNKTVRDGIVDLERRAKLAGASKVDSINLRESDDLKRFGTSTANIERVRAAYQRLREVQEEADKQPSFTTAIIQGGILLDVIQRGISIVKEATVGAALYAARTEQLGVALDAVSKANKVSSGTTAVLEKQIESLGVTTQDTRGNLARLIAAHVDQAKAAKIAAAAQDLGRVSGEGTAMAFERLTHAIVTGQPELLRYLGLNVNLELAYQRAAQAQGRSSESLGEYEKIQIRTNAVLAAAQSYQGVYAASLNTTTGRLLSLERKANEARNAIGEKFQAEAAGTLFTLEGIAGAGSKIPGVFADVARYGVIAGGAIAGIVGGPVIAAFGLTAIAVGTLSLAVSKLAEVYRDAKEAKELLFPSQSPAAEAENLAQTVTRQKFAEAAQRDRATAEEVTQREQVLRAQLQKEGRIKAAEAERQARIELIEAQGQDAQGVRGAVLEGQKKIRERSTFLDQSGIERDVTLSAETIRLVNAATQAKIAIEVRKTDKEIRDSRAKTEDATLQSQKQRIEESSRYEIAKIDGLIGSEAASRRVLEDVKLSLQKDGLLRAADVELSEVRARAAREIKVIEETEARKGTAAFRVRELVSQRLQQQEQQKTQVQNRVTNDVNLLDQALLNERVRRTRESDIRVEQNRQEVSAAHLESEKRDIDARRDAELQSLEFVHAVTLREKVGLESAKLAIEEKYLLESSAKQVEIINQRQEFEAKQLEQRLRAAGLVDSEIEKEVGSVRQKFAQQAIDVQQQYLNQVAAAERKTAIDAANTIIEHTRSTYERFKTSSNNLLDELFSSTKSWGERMKSVISSAFLTPLKEIASSQIAAGLTRIFTGRSVTFESDVQGGPLAGLRNTISRLGLGNPRFDGGSKFDRPNHLGDVNLVAGAVPVYMTNAGQQQGTQQIVQQVTGGSGLGTALGLGLATLSGAFGKAVSAVGGAAGIPAGATDVAIRATDGRLIGAGSQVFSGADRTNPLIMHALGSSTAGSSSAGGGSGILSTLAGFGGGLKSFLGFGENSVPLVGGGASTGTAILQSGSIGQKLTALGRSNAALLGGGVLAYDGLRRGGVGGLLETTGGGALIGFKYGGPIGALIGAGVGAIAGTIRLFIKSPEEKVQEKVKAIWGYSIDKATAKQIVAIGQQRYGGNLDMAVRAPETRELLSLWAQTYGQKDRFVDERIHSASLIESRGKLYQGAVYDNGTAYGYSSNLPTYGGVQAQPLSTGSPQSGSSGPVIVQVSPQATVDLWRTGTAQAIQGDPRGVAQSALQGNQASSSRYGTAVNTLSPSVITQ
jgi:hypothetical protein